MKKITFLLFGIGVSAYAFAQQDYSLDTIVVKARGDYSIEALSSSDMQKRHPDSLADVLDGVCGVDLRYRLPSGVQGDLSLRGSTYEQVGVLIDGVKLNDPQTGHHNLDIPLTAYDIERTEVAKDGRSAAYGAGALAGSVNFISRKPLERALKADAIFGGHALFGQGLSLSLPGRDLSARVSFEHKAAKAARPNTDFEYRTASLYLSKDLSGAGLDTLFGYQKKDFGADSFYSNLFPEEEEHTETILSRTGLNNNLTIGELKSSLFFRRHKDKFILRRNNPASVNYHTTYIYGLDSGLSLPAAIGSFIFNADLVEEEINSTNLGKHSRLHQALGAGFLPEIIPELEAECRFRLDHYNKWEWQESYNFGLGYGIIRDKLKLSASAGRSFRLPSFTELYYSAPGNKGDPNLKVEKADNFKAGVKFKDKGLELGIEGFLRRGYNLIDWTRLSSQDDWQATNLGRVDFRGAEFSAKWGQQAAFSYTYIDADKKTSGFFSKYALDVLKHQLLLGLYTRVFGLQMDYSLSYNQRYYGETYFVGGIYIGKRITRGDFSFEPFLKIDNFTNTKYSENPGVLLPGRWIKSGLKFEW